VSEAARFLLHRPDRSFGGMHRWGTAPHADAWHERLRADPAVKAVVETFVTELLPGHQDSFPENFVMEAERLAGVLTPVFLDAASKTVNYGVTHSSEAIAAGALNDLVGFEAIVDMAADILTPSESDQIEANETHLAIINGEYSEHYAEHLSENEYGYTANEFLKAYVDRVRITAGWRILAEHRHRDRLRYYWFRSLASDDIADADELAGAVAAGYETNDEDTLWQILTKVWDPIYKGGLVGRIVSGHPEKSVREAALTCLIEQAPQCLSDIVNELKNRDGKSRLLEIAIELGEMQHRYSDVKKSTKHEHAFAGAVAAALALPEPFGEVSIAAIALKNDKAPNFSDAASALIATTNLTTENLRVFRFMVDRHLQMPIEDDVRCVLEQSDNDDAAVEAIEAAMRHGMDEEVHAALNHKFAAVISRALKAVANPLSAPLPQHLLALAESKASSVRKTLVTLLESKPHPDHLSTLLRLVKDRWSSEYHYQNEDDTYPIARAAVPAISLLGAIDKPTADELYRTAIDSQDVDLRYEIFRLLLSNAEVDSQVRLLDLALNPGRTAVRRAAAHAFVAVSEHIEADVIARISAKDLASRIEPVASRLLLLLALRGDLRHVLAIAEALATNDKRKALLLLVIWVMRDRDLPTAKRIATMLPAGHPAIAWALVNAAHKFDETLLDDLGDPLSVDEVLLFMAPKKKK
jgi:HEAT repeat protein